MITAAASVPWKRLVWPLAVAEIVVWSGFYYAFPALLPYWEADLGWSKATLAGAFTLGLAAAALGAPVAGRLIDAGHGRTMMTAAAVLGAGLVASLAAVTQVWQFYAVWLALGLCMAGCLYEPAFAVVTRYLGAEARRGITVITLIAGLAGTVSFPLAYAMADAFGWRAAVLTYGALALVIAAPLMAMAGRGLIPAPTGDAPAGAKDASGLRRAVRQPAFWCLGAAFACVALNHGMVMTHLLPILADRGLATETAALAAAMVGPMQVAGRIAMMAAERHVSTKTVSFLSYVVTAVAGIVLLGAAAVPILVVGFVVLQGAGYGVTSITRPVVTAEVLGRRDFGTVAGALAVPFMGAFALSPTVAALIWEVGGYDAVIAASLAACGLGAVMLIAAFRWQPVAP